MQNDRLTLTVEPQWLEAAQEEGQSPALPRFSMVAYTGGPMRVGGFALPVIVDLAGMEIPSQKRPIRLQHDAGRGIGHTEAIIVTPDGQLVAEGVVSRGTADAAEVVQSGKNGFPWQASIGASVHKTEHIKEGQTVEVNGRTHQGPVLVARKTTLGEISFVDLGADGATSAKIAAEAAALEQKETDMESIKTRKEALLAEHGDHAHLILAALCDGKEDHEILSEIAAAQQSAILAQRDEAVAKVADLEAKLAEQTAALEAAAKDRDELAAKIKADEERRANTPVDPGNQLQAQQTVTSEQFAAMDSIARARFLADGGIVA
jgi:hypothetical protein